MPSLRVPEKISTSKEQVNVFPASISVKQINWAESLGLWLHNNAAAGQDPALQHPSSKC